METLSHICRKIFRAWIAPHDIRAQCSITPDAKIEREDTVGCAGHRQQCACRV